MVLVLHLTFLLDEGNLAARNSGKGVLFCLFACFARIFLVTNTSLSSPFHQSFSYFRWAVGVVDVGGFRDDQIAIVADSNHGRVSKIFYLNRIHIRIFHCGMKDGMAVSSSESMKRSEE